MAPPEIRCQLVGILDHHRGLDWPEGWPVPAGGDTVELPNLLPLTVRRVIWYPEGDPEPDDPANLRRPFVYLVIGPRVTQ